MWSLLLGPPLLGCVKPPAEADSPPASRTSDTAPIVDTAHPCGVPAVELGNGVTSHVPMGSEAVMVHGIQGGWHIDVSGAVSGLGPVVALHATITRVSDGVQLAGEQQPKNIELAGTCGGEFGGLQALIDDHTPSMPYQEFICSLVGETLRVELDVTDVAAPGRVAIDAAEVVAVADPLDRCP